MNGLLGSYDLRKEVIQSVYVCDVLKGTVVSLNLCNRNNVPAMIYVAVTDSLNTVLPSEWIEYGTEIGAKGVLERSSIVLGAGQYLTVKSNLDNVTATCWGVTTGSTTPVTPITINDTPTWETNSTLLTVYAGETNTVNLALSTPTNVNFSVTSGTVPSGMTLDATTGVLSGNPDTGSYNPSGSTITFDVTGTVGLTNTVNTFNITKRWKDGSTRELANTSAQAIKTITGTTTDGTYWIRPPGSPDAFQVHCYMSLESGGWMLALRTGTGNFDYYGSGGFLVSNWAGWAYTNKSQVDALGLDYTTQADTDCLAPTYLYSPFSDVMVIANREGQTSKRIGWRHDGGFANMRSVIMQPNERNATSILFGNAYNWLAALDVRGDTAVYTSTGDNGALRVGFKIRSDTGSSTSPGSYQGGFWTSAMHYGSQIGCGRENSNAAQWGGGFGGLYNGSTRFHKLNGHWWNHGDGRNSTANSNADYTSAFYGHAVYIR